jgi:hypothetical protein
MEQTLMCCNAGACPTFCDAGQPVACEDGSEFILMNSANVLYEGNVLQILFARIVDCRLW